jgi:hypothetical protein
MRFVVLLVAFMAISPAGAAVDVELPDEMLGAWCGARSWNFPDTDADYWRRADNVEECANRGGIYVRKDGWDYYRFGPRGSCKFVSVQLLEGEPNNVDRDGDVYRVRAECKGETETWHDACDLQTFEAQPHGVGGELEELEPWLFCWELPVEG